MKRVYPLILRDLKKILRWKPYALGLLIQPAAYLVIFAVAMHGNVRSISLYGKEASYLAFLIPGLIALQTFTLFTTQVSFCANDKRWGLFKAFMLTGIRPWEYILAQALNQALIVTVQGLFIMLIGYALSKHALASPVDYVILLAITILAVVFWTSLGISVGLRVESEEKRDLLWILLNLPVMFTSSVFYDVKKAAAWIAYLSYFNPLTYTSDIMRAIFFGHFLKMTKELGLFLIATLFVLWWCLHTVKNTKLVLGD